MCSLVSAAASATPGNRRDTGSFIQSPRLTDVSLVEDTLSLGDVRAHGDEDSAAASPDAKSVDDESPTKKAKRNRCFMCKKKVGLTGENILFPSRF